MRLLIQVISLSLHDYWHEKLLSACAILSLAAMLAPLLVLFGVRHGIISTMQERLMQDPRTLELIPEGSKKYGPEWFAELENHEAVGFVLPQTRTIAATMQLLKTAERSSPRVNVNLIATDVGDPLLSRWGADPALWLSTYAASLPGTKPLAADVSPAGQPMGSNQTQLAPPAAEPAPRPFPLALSDSAARKIDAKQGDVLWGLVDRVRNDKREQEMFPVQVAVVLPLEVQQRDTAFLSLELLVALEDYRDGRTAPLLQGHTASPRAAEGPLPEQSPEQSLEHSQVSPKELPEKLPEEQGAQGHEADEPELENPPSLPSRNSVAEREYPTFRLYSKGLDNVEELRLFLLTKGIQSKTQVEDIERVKSLNHAFTAVFALISAASVFGFIASTASSSLAGVYRKSRSLGIMRLLGYPRGPMMFFPVTQVLVSGFLGFLLSAVLYGVVAWSIDLLFAGSLPEGSTICSLLWQHFAAALVLVLAFSSMAALVAARKVTLIEPSEVIRDV